MPIELRYRTYFAYLDVPADVRRVIGRRVFRQTLKTDSRSVAERREPPIVAQWRATIATARKEPNANDAKFWRDRLRAAKTEEQRARVLDQIEATAWDIGVLNVDTVGDPPSGDPTAQAFYADATGVPTLEHLAEWQATCRTTAKTKDMARADIQRFAATFPLIRDVTRTEVRRWVTTMMHDGELKPKTMQRGLSSLRGYWRYLQGEGIVPEEEEPFAKLEVARQAKRSAPQSRRRAFEPADVVKLVAGAVARDDRQLANLITLAMWSGCRIEELCALRVADVLTDNSFRVVAAKTDAGVRVVPIHAELAPTLARLIAASDGGYVLSGLTFNKYGDRSNAIGKRFGRLKADLGHGSQLVFHSIRRTVVTILENAGVSENVVADICGHEKPRITYGLYSGGTTLEVKRAALAKLAYPATP